MRGFSAATRCMTLSRHCTISSYSPPPIAIASGRVLLRVMGLPIWLALTRAPEMFCVRWRMRLVISPALSSRSSHMLSGTITRPMFTSALRPKPPERVSTRRALPLSTSSIATCSTSRNCRSRYWMLEPSGAVMKICTMPRSSCGASSVGNAQALRTECPTMNSITHHAEQAPARPPTIHSGLRPSIARRRPAA